MNVSLYKWRVFQIFIFASLVILGFLLLEVLNRHYWLMFFIWLILPPVQLWNDTYSIKSNLDPGMVTAIRKLLLACAIVLSLINLNNYEKIRHSVGYQFIDSYLVVKSYECESPENALGFPEGSPPSVCYVEKLTNVSWYSRVFLYLSEWLFMLLVIAIPSIVAISKPLTFTDKHEDI
jgi:hypothetical protein